MTRGRPPNAALKEAEIIAGRRGDVRIIPGTRSDEFNLILFEKNRTTFVKVKRSVTQFSWSLEILHQYQREIVQLLRMPQTVVTVQEFWVRHPKGTWQFFLIRPESIVEIRADGTQSSYTANPMTTADTAGEESSPGDDESFTKV